jgi:hypothetical protein
MRLSLVLSLSLIWAGNLWGQQDQSAPRVYETHHVNPHSPEIDGKLDDPAWESVPWSENFTQGSPNSGEAPSQNTQFKVLYDDKNIYFGIRAFDTDPELIVNRVARRDDFDADWVEVNIDSYYDKRTAFSFTLSPAAVRGDELISNDGNDWDSSWDPVWYGATSVDEKGWIAEMRIPLSQLRFSAGDNQTWGLQVNRQLYRKDERSNWRFIPNNSPGWVSQFGQLKGITGIKPSRRMEVLPYVVGDISRFRPEANNPFRTGQIINSRLGLDTKFGLTSNLTLDVTVNPDFGQVEADPSQVNLSAFEVFFQERRPFFVEGKNITDLKVGGGGPYFNDQLFYSRRIGRQPQFSPSLASGESIEQKNNTSILSALKITGKTQSGLSIGIVNAVTQKTNAEIDNIGFRRKEAVEPFTNYTVSRLQQDFNDGKTSFGGMFTATNRDIKDPSLNFLNRAAYTGGVDFRHQWDDRTYSLDANVNFSHIRGDTRAIIRAQRSSARFFQRPDADYVAVDSTKTYMSGHGGTVTLRRSGTSPWNMGLTGTWRSPGFELNDLGFLRQADVGMQTSWLGYRSNNPGWVFRRYNLFFNQWQGWNFGKEQTFFGGNVNGWGQFKNYWSMWVDLDWSLSGVSTSALRGGPALKNNGNQSLFMGINSDDRRNFRVSLGGGHSRTRGNQNRFSNVRFSVNYRPTDAVNVSLNPFFSDSRNETQYVSTESFLNNDRYILGQINQKTLGISFRMNYSVTPNLSFQYYGQPFVSSGSYSNFKRVVDARADEFADRFNTFTGQEITYDAANDSYSLDENIDGTSDYSIDNPDFSFRQFRSNFVMRWEYTPGSTLFFVWAQERTGSSASGNFSVRDDLRDLFNVYPSNFFLVKFNRWFSI